MITANVLNFQENFFNNPLNYALTLWNCQFTTAVCGYILLLPRFIEIPVFNAKSVGPDQMPHLVCQCSFYGALGMNVFTVTYIHLNIWF